LSFKLLGQIRESENNVGIPGLEVRAFDRDVRFDDLLGSVITDEAGNFDLRYEERDFKGLFEGKPDIYLIVKAKDGRTVYTTEKNVRVEAGKTERFDDIYIPRALIEGTKSVPIGLRFSEKMSGFFLENTDDCQRGAEVGGRRGNGLEIRCRITIDDLDRFLKESDHTAQLAGQVDYGDLGDKLPLQNGVFNLFRFEPTEAMRKMTYRFHFQSKSGQPYLFLGEKDIHREQHSTEVLKDMTTLYTKIYHGYSQAGKIASAGILTFHATTLAEMFSSLEVINAANSFEQVGAISRFFGFVSRELEAVYLEK
jgi:hypothetical protein